MKNELSLVNARLSDTYCSILADDEKNKKIMINALNGCDVLLNDIVGETIVIENVFIQERETIDEKTGEARKKYRTILIDKNGKTYATSAYGVYNSLMNVFALYGTPDTWKEPKTFEVKKIKNNKNGFESLKLILK